MAENARIVREQRRWETSMNVPTVDENLYVHALRSRNMSYNTWQRQLKTKHNRGNRNLIFLPDSVVYKQTTK